MLQRLGAHADILILDTPPVSAVTDSTVLGTLTDGTILVVERGRAGTPSISRAIDTFKTVGVRILGVVLNKAVPSEGTEYYYYPYDDPERATAELPIKGKSKSNKGPFEPGEPAIVADQS
jgi:Mrp family chromosome partitioning ATPase